MLWVLLLMSVIGGFCFLERMLYLHKNMISRSKFTGGIFNLIDKGRLLEALTVCQENPGPMPSVIRAGLLNYKESPEKMTAAMREAALLQVPMLERRVSALIWIAKTAPLVGLLGTLIPLVRSFILVSAQGPYASSDLFIGEVGESLLTTAVGILIAIMAMSSWYWVDGRMRAMMLDMELAASELLQFRHERVLGLEEAESEPTLEADVE